MSSNQQNGQAPSKGLHPTSRGLSVGELSGDIAMAAAGVVERVLSQLAGRIYSPRIKLLDIDQVCETTGQGRSTVYELIKQEKFPKPQRNLGKNMWRESALIAWADANDPNRDDQ